MMPALHNYITVDPAAFIANPKHLEMVYDMCKVVGRLGGTFPEMCPIPLVVSVWLSSATGKLNGWVFIPGSDI